jgi:predicted metal-dependent phosphoesterase TrpH
MSYKIDLHTHSVASPDGGISREQYKRAMHEGILDYVAVTDHNTISFARMLREEFGERVIIGEEIMTTAGEIVGLYLDEVVPPGLSPLETVKQIKDQGGLVYIPHPFETIRKGLRAMVIDELIDHIDIIEVYNGRAFIQDQSEQAVVWARMHQKIAAASSDAHGLKGLGKTYTVIPNTPHQENLMTLLDQGSLHTASPGIRALLYPKYHRLIKKVKRIK